MTPIKSIENDPFFSNPISQPSTTDVDFGKFIKKAIYGTDARIKESIDSTIKLMKGEAGIHETMIKSQKASVSMNLLLQVRKTAMASYKQIMQMSF